ncbi:MAG: 3-isopropylmalate dehydrogenase [Firmicutes bacterium]|nr:3-isopropylmalate dehydrogenase [Bacillota bacterium]
MQVFEIALLPGDGVGPEVIREARKVLLAVGKRYSRRFAFTEGLIGGAAIDAAGTPLPEDTLEICRKSGAVLLGAVGGAKWDGLPGDERPEAGLLGIRKALQVFANLRPVRVFPALVGASTLKRHVVEGVDLVVVRELTGGVYFGQPRGRFARDGGIKALDTMVYTRFEVERVARVAFGLASRRRRRVTSVDKANVLESSRLWREVVTEVGNEYPDVELNHMYVDNCAMQLIRDPRQFDVVLTENMFGDILSDEAAMLAGSLGMLPSASLGHGRTALCEPVHGSAPDIAGKNIANPLATVLSAAMLLRYSLGLDEESRAVEEAVMRVLEKGYRTADIFMEGTTLVGTAEMGDLLVEEILRGA